jgi:hypothetical protein
MKLALLALLLVTSSMLTAQSQPPSAATAKSPASEPSPKLSDDAQKNILIDYQAALLAQNQKYLAEQAAQATSSVFMATCQRETKAAGFPDGTQCQVDTTKKLVTAILPAPAPANKPEKER